MTSWRFLVLLVDGLLSLRLLKLVIILIWLTNTNRFIRVWWFLLKSTWIILLNHLQRIRYRTDGVICYIRVRITTCISYGLVLITSIRFIRLVWGTSWLLTILIKWLARLLLSLCLERLLLQLICFFWGGLFIKGYAFQWMFLGGLFWAYTHRVCYLRNIVVLTFIALIYCYWLIRLARLLSVDFLRWLSRKLSFYLFSFIWLWFLFTTLWILIRNNRCIRLIRLLRKITLLL